jgi:uncharacterized lipoprotein YmbA
MKILAVVPFVLMLGCSSTPPERHFYLLRGEATDSGVSPAPAKLVGIGRVTIAAYLDRAGVVVQTGSREIRPARFHEWGEPLDNGVRHYLRSELVDRLGYEVASDVLYRDAWDYRVDISIETLHGSLSDGAWINAGFVVSEVSGNQATVAGRVIEHERLTRDGYPGLIDAHTRLLDQLAAAIETALGELRGEGS